MISVADGFGIDLVTAARPSFDDAGFEVVYDKTYPARHQDFTPIAQRGDGKRRRHLRRLLLSARDLRA